MAAGGVYPGYAVPPCPRVAPDDLTLVALDSAEGLSGEFARHAAMAWGFHQVANRAARVAVELISRAVETTGPTGSYQPLTGLGDAPPFLGIRVSLLKHAVLVEVWDSDPTSPLPAEHSGLDGHLTVVHEMCLRWNWYQPGSGGKVIWAEIAIAPHHLPQRTAGQTAFPEPDKPAAPETDVSVLRSVLEGLQRLDARGHRAAASLTTTRDADP